MKRTIRTLTAATMAGAIAFAATPAADAQIDIDPTEVATKIIEGRYPAVLVAPNGTYYELVNGEYKEAATAPAGAENAAEVSLADNGDIIATLPDGSGKTVVLGNKKDLDQSGQTGQNSTGGTTTTVQAPAPEATGETTAPATSTSTSTATTLTVPAGTDTTVSATIDANLDGAGAAGAGSSELSPGAIAGIAAAAIGIPVVIAGVTYFLNQDGETLVGSSDRVNQEPTPEEKAESDRLRAEHADEIAAQEAAAQEAAAQEAAAAVRGVEAETGSNTVARTLFALALASLLGAAAFLAGRRFLV